MKDQDQPMAEAAMLEAWGEYGISTPGYIGYALRHYFTLCGITQDEARVLLGLQGKHHDTFWLYLQATHLPPDHNLNVGLARILTHIQQTLDVDVEVNLELLTEALHAWQTSPRTFDFF